MRALLLLFLLTGCSMPRVFQSKVPPPVEDTPQKIEAQREAADLIARKIESPAELIPVAQSLSHSLGSPLRNLVDVKSFDLPTASHQADSNLQQGIRDMQEQLRQVNLRLAKLQGKEIEGTGFSVLGPGMATVVVGLIVLGVACPPALTFLFFVLRRTKAVAGILVNKIEEAAKSPETAAAIATLKSNIGEAIHENPQKTTLLKDVITNLKTA